MAVRFVLVQPADVAEPSTFERDGVRWAANEFGMPVGRPDCGQDYPKSILKFVLRKFDGLRHRCRHDEQQNKNGRSESLFAYLHNDVGILQALVFIQAMHSMSS